MIFFFHLAKLQNCATKKIDLDTKKDQNLENKDKNYNIDLYSLIFLTLIIPLFFLGRQQN